nr:immunoglobulin heavy chain junction region [Macaca mulatta]
CARLGYCSGRGCSGLDSW